MSNKHMKIWSVLLSVHRNANLYHDMPSFSIRSGVSMLSVKGIDIKYFRPCGKVKATL